MHEMLSSLLSLKNEVDEALKRTGNYSLCMKTTEWNMIQQLCTFLAVFKDLTDVASGSIVGLSVVPLIRAKVKTACEINNADNDEIVLLKRKILLNLDKRFPMTSFVKVASLLDPASKNKKYIEMSFDDKRDLLLSCLRPDQVQFTGLIPGTVNDNNVIDVRTETEPSSKRLKLTDAFEDEVCDDDVYASVVQYLSSTEKPTDDERGNPLLYWKNSKHVALSALARKYLTVNASSVLVESMFSVTGLLINGRRSSMAPHTMNKLSSVHDNFLLFNN